MILGNRINGTESTNDYLLCARSDDFFLAVKPICQFEPMTATFGFGLRFRAVSELPNIDPECHKVVWGELPFCVLKPTHASVSCVTHVLHAKELKGKGNSKALMELLEAKGLFVALATTVLSHLGAPEGLQHLEGDCITDGLREILGEKLASVESSVGASVNQEAKSVDDTIEDKVESFLDLVDSNDDDPFSGGGTVH